MPEKTEILEFSTLLFSKCVSKLKNFRLILNESKICFPLEIKYLLLKQFLALKFNKSNFLEMLAWEGKFRV